MIEPRTIMKGSYQKEILSSRALRPSSSTQQIDVTVVVRRKLGSHFSNRRPFRTDTYLTREEFASTYGASLEDIATVQAFATQYGLKVQSVDAAARLIKLTGTIQQFNVAFGVDMMEFANPTGTFRSRVGPISVPSHLIPVITGVLGLDTNSAASPRFRIHLKSQAAAVSYSPLQVADAYQFPAATGAGQCIAVIELGGGYTQADLVSFFQNLNLPIPTVTAVAVDGGSNSPTGDPDGPDGEVELDIEMAGAIAPKAHIAAYFGPNTNQGFLQAISAAVHDATLKPSIISISWGGEEHSWTAQARNLFNAVFQDAATMGVTILAASGDNGADDGTPNNTPAVDFPAASPYVIGCGGTTLTLSGSTILNEVVWDELASQEGASGGGVSEGFHLPAYQDGDGVPHAIDGFVGRGVPDVAANADPNTGYNVVVDGQQTVIGGTSACAPLYAGLLARINELLGKNVGYVNPKLYTDAVKATFRQITSGNNGYYSAKAGWNPCTGLGTPNGTALLAALKTSLSALKG